MCETGRLSEVSVGRAVRGKAAAGQGGARDSRCASSCVAMGPPAPVIDRRSSSEDKT